MSTAEAELGRESGSLRATARPELLAPAGDRTCLIAAIENGADAVYFGLQRHNARARATNFDGASLGETMALLHRRGVKGYVTLNTLVFPRELPDLEATIRQVAEAGVDAVIIQDLGLARLIRAITPDLEIHASTQMTVTSAEGVRLARELGCSRVILARELSLAEIGKIREKAELPLEVFVHGALCVAYSGQCLTSEALGGRSANRGECAQACRLPYEIICDGEPRDLGPIQYLLSPQDLAAYDLIPALIDLGVASLKIEGRLKTPEYVANITRHYRDALDSAWAGRPVASEPREVHEMELSFSRGFSHGFLDGNNHKVLVRGDHSKKRGIFLGKVVSVEGSRVRLDLAAPVKNGDGVVFDGDDQAGVPEQGGRVYEVFRAVRGRRGRSSTRQAEPEGLSAGTADLAFGRQDLDLRRLVPGQRVWKTDDPELTRRLRKTFEGPAHRKVDLAIHVLAAVGAPLRLKGRTSSGYCAEVVSEALLAPADSLAADEELLREQLSRLGGSVYQLSELTADLEGGPMVPRSLLNQLRRELVERLDQAALIHPARTLAAEAVLPALKASLLDRLSLEGAPSALPTMAPGLPPTPSLPHKGGGEKNSSLDEAQRVPTEPVALEKREEANNSSLPPCGGGSGWGVQGAPPTSPSPSRGGSPPASARQSSATPETSASLPELFALCRNTAQVEAAIASGITTLYAEYQDITQYKEAVAAARRGSVRLFLATPRIEKPKEGAIFRYLARQGADGILVRNAGGLYYCAGHGIPFVADFALNTANELTAEFLKNRGALRVTASYDLSFEQLEDLIAAVPRSWLEVVIHQQIPMFHMEHCVFCAFLSPGTDKTNCGRPCDHHDVKLRDRVGKEHPLKADVGCRNTLFNAVPQTAAEYLPRLLAQGVQYLRVEFLDDSPDTVSRTLSLYREAIEGRRDAKTLWRDLKATNRYGVTRGPLNVL